MEPLKYILFFSTFIWLITPVRQFGTRFFYFFLVLALIDFIFILISQFVLFNSLQYYLLCVLILLYAALFELKTKNRVLLIICFAVPGLLILLYQPQLSIVFQTIIHLIIFVIFLRVLIIHFAERRKLLWFHLILIMYEFSILLKFFVYYNELEIGLVYYYVTTAIQILIGIFFLFINEKNSPKLRI